MKTIGLLGGVSWESTQSYYRLLNEGVKRRLGGLHSARIAMVSVDFGPLSELQKAGKWDEIGEVLAEASRQVERAGADLLLIAANTMHLVADQIEAAISIPLIHIADATASAIQRKGLQRVGLIGTSFTMEKPFYRERLAHKHGIEVLVPDDAARAEIHRVIYEELVLGEVREDSRARYLEFIDELAHRGAEGVVLGCTEIPLLVKPGELELPLFDTTALHVAAALEAALA